MIKADKHSIAGILLAIFFVAVLAGTGLLSPIFANGLGRAPREVRLGVELGLIEPDQCNNRYLKQNITKKDFAEKTAIVMNMLGIQDCSANFMHTNGITDSYNQNSLISRREAVEMMCRATMLMNSNRIFKMPITKANNFRDYKVPEKYSAAMGYMQSKFVVRGLSNNNLGSNRKLTKREAIYFLYRLYEAISSDMMANIPNDGLCFIDIAMDHPIMSSIKNLTAAGAFDRAILRPSFDGDSYLLPDDLTEIIGGIFDRSGKECDMLRLQTIFSDKEEYTTRRQMTLVLEFLLDTLANNRINTAAVDYKDVTSDDIEFQALSKLSAYNINPGYGTKVFAANENVTWFEAVNLIDQTLSVAGITKSTKMNPSAPATHEDFERLKNILLSKKATIRNILGAKKAN